MEGSRVLSDREAIARKVEKALEGEEYSVVEMASDLIRLARHPMWEEHDRLAGELEGAVRDRDALIGMLHKERRHSQPRAYCSLCEAMVAMLPSAIGGR